MSTTRVIDGDSALVECPCCKDAWINEDHLVCTNCAAIVAMNLKIAEASRVIHEIGRANPKKLTKRIVNLKAIQHRLNIIIKTIEGEIK